MAAGSLVTAGSLVASGVAVVVASGAAPSGSAETVVSSGAVGSTGAVGASAASVAPAALSETQSPTASIVPAAASRFEKLTVDIAARSGSASAASLSSSDGVSPSRSRCLVSCWLAILGVPVPSLESNFSGTGVESPELWRDGNGLSIPRDTDVMKQTPEHLICRLAEEAAATAQPEAALAKLRELRNALERFENERVVQALRSGSSYSAIARALGISRQAAHRRYRDLAPMAIERLRLSSHSRRAVQLACQEADAAGADGVASEHLLLGVLRSGGGTSIALEAIGLTVDAIRRCLTGARLAGEAAGEKDVAGRAVLEQAAEIASARSADHVEPEHIALAALDGEDGGAAGAVTAIGVKPASVRERLGCTPDLEVSDEAA